MKAKFKYGLLAGIIVILIIAGIIIYPTAKIFYYAYFLHPAEFIPEGEKLYLKGIIGFNTPKKLQAAMEENPQITTLVLKIIPGSADDEANMKMGRWIHDKGLNTHLESSSHIVSGGVDLYLAGRKRTMDEGAKLGVHSWNDPLEGVNGSELPRDHPDHEFHLDYYKYIDITEDFYWFTLEAAPFDGMHYMTMEDIETYSVITP